MIPDVLPFEYPFRWRNDDLAAKAGVGAEAAALLEQRDRDLEDFLAAPSPAKIRGCSVENGSGQVVPDASFTTLEFNSINWSDGSYAKNIYTVPVTGVYSTVVRLRLPDNLPATFSYGAGVHTANTDGPWFLWAYSVDSTLGSATDRSALQITRTKEFAAGVQLRAYCYIDRGSSTTVNSAAFDVIYQGSRPTE